MTNIIKHIENQGGMLSGQLAEYLVSTQNLTETTARKRIERLQSPIHKLKGLFADNQSFIYHSDNYNNQEYFECLEMAFEKSAKRCYAVIVAINYSHGIISKIDLPNFTFSPKTKIKGHLLYSTLIDKLKQTNVLVDYDEEHYTLNNFLLKDLKPNFRHYKSI
ncbi:MAG: hypothetical protein HC831_24240, partial [Chloroflexia bacterium]|nr:hypothetical protein [Chloroflexia bacterium]